MNPEESSPRPLSPASESISSWELRLHAELRRLPTLVAPAALAPRVLAAIRMREAMRARAWYRRPVTTWPPALRVTFGVIAAACFGLLAWSGHILAAAAQPPALLVALQSAGAAVCDALLLAARTLLTPTRVAILAAIVVSQLVLLTAGGALWRSILRACRATDFSSRALP